MRKKLYIIIDDTEKELVGNKIYDIVMMLVIIISLIPLAFKSNNIYFEIIDKIATIIFIIDYFIRWITSDLKLKKGIVSFFIYPFTFMAIIDLISILPSLSIVNSAFKALRIFRLIKTFKVLRIFKTFRYSRNIQIIINVINKSKISLLAVASLAVGYIIISALIIFNIEPETFNSIFDAIYWATVSLTTVGYGDIYPITIAGKIITMLSSFIGIAIVALPSGIITAGFMSEIEKVYNKNNKELNDEDLK